MSEVQADLTLKRPEKGFVLHEEGREKWNLLRDAGGYSPMEAVEAAAAACGSYVLSEILKRSRVDARVVEAEVRAERFINDDDVFAFAALDITFKIRAEEKDRPRIEKLLPKVKKYCPVIRSLNPSIEIREHAEYVD